MGKFYEGLSEELSIHIRQSAWLAAKPTPEKASLNKVEPVSRLQQMKNDGIEPDLPPISTPWLVDYLMEVGPFVAAGMGAGPIGWRDIAAWQDISGIVLHPWEARMIRRLSTEYLTMLQDARKPDCPAPYVVQSDADIRAEIVANKVRSIFGALAAQQRDRL